MKKKYVSMPWIIIYLIFIIFFPVGFCLMVHKLINERDRYYKNSLAASNFLLTFNFTIAFILLIFFSLFDVFESDASEVLGALLIPTTIFLPMACFTEIYKKRGLRFNLYIDIISSTGTNSIDRIAKMSFKKYDLVCKDLKIMVEEEILWNARLDLQARKIILLDNIDDEEIQTFSVKCPNCGASNAKKDNEVVNCTYCGTTL